MAKRPDTSRFGSPFDPLFPGKIQREVAREDPCPRSRDPLAPGCGRDGCLICYPERAGSRAPPSYFTPFSGSPEDRYNEMKARVMELSDSFALPSSIWREPPRPSGPPSSYTSARKEVEDWLIPSPTQSFSSIVGNEATLETLRDAIQAPVKHADLYAAYNMKMPKGALIYGPPGCGKTMFARAAASEMRDLYGTSTEFLSIPACAIQSMFVGETESHIRNIFAFAREYKAHQGHPLLVFIDEAEVLFPDRTGRVRRVAPWEESNVATFLAEMDGVQESGAFVLLATNRPEVIDGALLRDGRCDFKIEVRRPTFAAAEIILRNNFTSTLLGTDPLDLLVNAALESLFDPHKIITEAHMMRANLAKREITIPFHKHFLLEHILSGAMIASIPARATRLAFARDKLTGTPLGVLVPDVLAAVNGLFEENRRLEHSFAREEFERTFLAECEAEESDQ